MADILILESEARYRVLLRFILEGINHRVLEAGDRGHPRAWEKDHAPDLVIMGIHLADETPLGDWPDWQRAMPEAPILILFSGDRDLKASFLESWGGPSSCKCLDQPVEPYPFLVMVKAMITAPAEWRRGGQHAL